jgi:hypothetical protein
MASRKQFLLRLDPALYAELEAWAAGELRSVNGQMEYLLRQAVTARKGGRRPGTTGGSTAPAEAPAPPGSAAEDPATGSAESGAPAEGPAGGSRVV